MGSVGPRDPSHHPISCIGATGPTSAPHKLHRGHGTHLRTQWLAMGTRDPSHHPIRGLWGHGTHPSPPYGVSGATGPIPAPHKLLWGRGIPLRTQWMASEPNGWHQNPMVGNGTTGPIPSPHKGAVGPRDPSQHPIWGSVGPRDPSHHPINGQLGHGIHLRPQRLASEPNGWQWDDGTHPITP